MGQLFMQHFYCLREKKLKEFTINHLYLWESNDRNHAVKCILEIQQCQILYSIAGILYYTRMLFPRIRGQSIANHLVYTQTHSHLVQNEL